MLKFFLLGFYVVLNVDRGSSTLGLICSKDQLPTIWTGGPFCWPCTSVKNLCMKNGNFNSSNIIATRAQIYKDDAFIVLPRYKRGNPATLAKLNLNRKTCQICLEPYPNWSFNEECKAGAIQNAVDIVLDSQDTLWVLDIGIVNTLEQPLQLTSPKVVAINVKTGQVIKVIDLGGLVIPGSRLQYLVVDYTLCGRPYLYISDAAARTIIVYDVLAGKGYRLVLPEVVVSRRRDVLYIALIRKCDGSTVLYFTYLSGKRLFSIDTEYLRKGIDHGNIKEIGIKPGKIVIVGTDNGAAIFFRYEGQSKIYRWDTNTKFSPENFLLVYRGDDCLLATHTLADYKRGRMRILSSNFQDYLKGTVGCGAVQSLAFLET